MISSSSSQRCAKRLSEDTIASEANRPRLSSSPDAISDQTDWDELPTELWLDIVLRLDPRSVARTTCTCQRLSDIVSGGDVLRRALQRLPTDELEDVGVCIIAKEASRVAPVLTPTLRSLTLAAEAKRPMLLDRWLYQAHEDTNAAAVRLLLSQPEYDLFRVKFSVEDFREKFDMTPRGIRSPTMIRGEQYSRSDMVDIVWQWCRWQRQFDGDKVGIAKAMRDFSTCFARNLKKLVELLDFIEPLVEMIVEGGHAASLISTILEHTCFLTRVTGTDIVLKTLLDWRGKRGEFVDLRPHIRAPSMVGDLFRHLPLRKLVMEWRGPAGEFIDFSQPEVCIVAFSSIEASYLPELLNWRGPSGQFIDLAQRRIIKALLGSEFRMSLTDILALLMTWTAPDGSSVSLDIIVEWSTAYRSALRRAFPPIIGVLDSDKWSFRNDTLSFTSEVIIIDCLLRSTGMQDALQTLSNTKFGRRVGGGLALTQDGAHVIIQAMRKEAYTWLPEAYTNLVTLLRYAGDNWRWSVYNFVSFLRDLASWYFWLHDTSNALIPITEEIVCSLDVFVLKQGVLSQSHAEMMTEPAADFLADKGDDILADIAYVISLFRSAAYIYRTPHPPLDFSRFERVNFGTEPQQANERFCTAVSAKCDSILSRVPHRRAEYPARFRLILDDQLLSDD